MSTITIETYSELHQQAVAVMILEIQQAEFQVDIDLERQPDLLTIPDFYQQGKGNFWIAKNNGEVIGTIALLDMGREQGNLRKMFVKKDYRGKEYGVGQQLLNTLLSWARVQGLKEIFLGTTDGFKAAHRFYEKNGFEKIARELLPDTFLLVPVDTRFYVLRKL
jgi:GNAT superfamily N-acetyltransferase